MGILVKKGIGMWDLDREWKREYGLRTGDVGGLAIVSFHLGIEVSGPVWTPNKTMMMKMAANAYLLSY
jgi:hypothetical protein